MGTQRQWNIWLMQRQQLTYKTRQVVSSQQCVFLSLECWLCFCIASKQNKNKKQKQKQKTTTKQYKTKTQRKYEFKNEQNKKMSSATLKTANSNLGYKGLEPLCCLTWKYSFTQSTLFYILFMSSKLPMIVWKMLTDQDALQSFQSRQSQVILLASSCHIIY